MADEITDLRIKGLHRTVYCLCGASAGGWDYGEVPEWAKTFMAEHPRGVDGHGPASEAQAKATRDARSRRAALADAPGQMLIGDFPPPSEVA